jgi:hypothetical protein
MLNATIRFTCEADITIDQTPIATVGELTKPVKIALGDPYVSNIRLVDSEIIKPMAPQQPAKAPHSPERTTTAQTCANLSPEAVDRAIEALSLLRENITWQTEGIDGPVRCIYLPSANPKGYVAIERDDTRGAVVRMGGEWHTIRWANAAAWFIRIFTNEPWPTPEDTPPMRIQAKVSLFQNIQRQQDLDSLERDWLITTTPPEAHA